MNRVDIVLFIVLAAFALRGFWRGFSREFFGFIGLIGGLAIAAASYQAATAYVPEIVPQTVRPIVAFGGVFFLVNLVANLIGLVVHRLLGIVFLSPVNRVAGAVFGVVKGAALAAITLLLLLAHAPTPGLESEVERSRLARPLLGMATEVGRDVREGRRLELPAPGHDVPPPARPPDAIRS